MYKEIRDNWFKDRKANYIKINDDLKILEWEKPGSIYMSVRYVMDYNNLYITGDLYSEILCLTEPANLEDLVKYDLYYFSKKIRVMEKSKSEFNQEKAVKDNSTRYR